MKDISFEDLIPANIAQTRRQQAMNLSFDDLIPKQEPGIIDKFIANQKQRGADLANAVNATSIEPTGNQQTPGETLYQAGLHNVVGGLAQVPATAINGAVNVASKLPINWNSGMSPEGIQRVQDIKAKAAQLANSYAQNEQQYTQDNPRAARNFQATRELANLIPFGSPEVRAATEVGLDAAGNAAKNAIKDIPKAIEKTPLPSSEVAKNISRTSYAEADAKGGILTPEFGNKFYDTINQMRPQTEHGAATVGDTSLTKLLEDWKVLRDKPISLQAAQEMDEGLATRIDSHVDKTTGKLDKQGQELYDVQTKLREHIDNATANDIIGDPSSKDSFDALKRARNEWSTALRLADMERIIKRASMTDNPATSIKTGFRTLASNPTRMRGYTAAEKAAIEKAAESGIIGNALRTVLGSRLIGALAGAAAGSGAGALGAGIGLLAGAAQSGASRAAATALQTGRANKAIKTVGQRIPKEIWKMNPKEAQATLKNLKE